MKAHAATESATWRQRGAGKLAMDATSPDKDAAEKRQAAARMLLDSGMSREEIFAALRTESARRKLRVQVRGKDGKLTPYGRRVYQLREMLSGEAD